MGVHHALTDADRESRANHAAKVAEFLEQPSSPDLVQAMKPNTKEEDNDGER